MMPAGVDRREVKPGGATGRMLPVATARVLIVDDERGVTDAIRHLLSAHGLAAVAALTPAEALMLAGSQSFDAALIDLNFEKGQTSGRQGLELVSALRSLRPTLPVIVMTAWGSMELVLDALKRGARDFIEKPWDPSRLVGAIKAQIEIGSAVRRVSELEAEVRELRGASATLDASAGPLSEMRLLDVEGVLVKQAMEKYRGNISRAARALGLSRSALYRRLERHNIQ
jgi:DNA-binding NtrC family response regulator